jgi:hemerythrin
MGMNWTSSWELGLPAVDAGHQRIVEAIADLQGAILSREHGAVLPRVLATLREVRRDVLADERRRVAGCVAFDPGPVLTHLDAFGARLDEVAAALAAGDAVAWELHWFLRDWLREHLRLLRSRCALHQCLASVG